MIDQRFVDVDFSKQGRPTGDLGGGLALDTRKFGDALRTLSKDELIAIAQDPNYTGCEQLITRIYDQNGDPSCTSNATCQAHEIKQAQQYGKDKVIPLSQLSLYKRVGSARSGSSVSENLHELVNNGVLPLDTPENHAKGFTHFGPQAHYSSYRLPEGWQETAKIFRGFEYFELESSAEFYTALALCMPVAYGRAGHSICAVRLMYENGRFVRKYVNSWGKWGSGGGDFDHGFGFDSERAGGFSWAFCLRAVHLTDLQGPKAI
jgi:hypothetical protein